MADVAEDDLDLLVDLSEGSAGKALSLANDKALNLYRDMSALLGALPKLDAQALHSFADKFARSGDDGGQFRLIGDLLAQWILRTTRAGAIEGRGGLDRWVEVWDKAARLFERTEAVNLQRKQVLLDVFLSLAQAARGA
jgi:DNA polymerase-3 subunit delta'